MDKKSERFKELRSKKVRLIPYEIVKKEDKDTSSNTQAVNAKESGKPPMEK